MPADNPFRDKAGWKPEIYTLGNRNVQGAALHPEHRRLWTHEHGPQGGDEVNVIRAGAQLRLAGDHLRRELRHRHENRRGHAKPGMEQPLHYWVPSIAPSGMAFYTGDRFRAGRAICSWARSATRCSCGCGSTARRW